jgi:hypothetical protein
MISHVYNDGKCTREAPVRRESVAKICSEGAGLLLGLNPSKMDGVSKQFQDASRK